MNPTATTPETCDASRDTYTTSPVDFSPWAAFASAELSATLGYCVENRPDTSADVDADTEDEDEDDGHFAFLASSAFEVDALDAADNACPTPQRCAATGCRGLCLPPSAA